MAEPIDSVTPDERALFEATSFLQGANGAFIEQLHARWLDDPNAVSESWRAFFEGLDEPPAQVRAEAQGPSWRRSDWPPLANGELVSALDMNWPAMEHAITAKVEARSPGATADEVHAAAHDSVRAIMLIRNYRIRGHLIAKLDPLGLEQPPDHPELDPATYGFTEADYDRPIFLDMVLGLETGTLRQILELVRRTYCGTLGIEFMHISDPVEKRWIQERIEGPDKEVSFTPEGKHAILNKLIEAEGFEKFLQVKYTGTKRFGLEGAESLIPAMEQIVKRGGQLGVKEIVLGMPHRGRLNVLANVLMKPYRAIFNEFRGGSANPDEVEGSGDVKYHLGTSGDRDFDGNLVHLSLTANPSHLEAVNPVVLGKVRAKQFQRGDTERKEVVAVLLHGDAAFAGQGIVAECLGLSGLKGHRTGGTIHIIVNNQIGFTTSPRYARSSPYPSDVAKTVQAPIFHVNGDDPEAVVFAARIATEFHHTFNKDVVIDMFCYRRHGHNEADEPAFTQPLMYRTIRQHPTTLQLYSEQLERQGFADTDIEQAKAAFHARLEADLEASSSYRPNKADWLEGRWAGLEAHADEDRKGDTAVPMATLHAVGEALSTVPEGFNAHRTIRRLLDHKRKMFEDGRGIDWSTAEALAFGTLLVENYPVRLSGQDSGRGTFSQRHSVLVDQENEERFIPLNAIRPDQAQFEVIDSMLSEAAVLGFEYGYSLAEPNALVLWEAQFGDFANGAQVIIDQFIASGEWKWLRLSGLVLLLPHGYEGQGPEHSSARIERYLQLCAGDNMQVANCTTPANYFHILRRQLHRRSRKPLVIFTPKSLLRHKRVVSTLEQMSDGTTFHRVLLDDAEGAQGDALRLKPDEAIRRVVLCSGKVYYDLFEEREARGIDDVYLMRVEQLYPFPAKSLLRELSRFSGAEVVWCQEEPRNMGAWSFIEPNLEWVLIRASNPVSRARYVGRPPSASTAAGLLTKHVSEQQALVNEALTIQDGN